jgi:hypothetical protein
MLGHADHIALWPVCNEMQLQVEVVTVPFSSLTGGHLVNHDRPKGA